MNYISRNIIAYGLMFPLVSLVLLSGYTQKSDFVFTNFTIENGLPSNECYEIIQDSKDFVWIATDNGVARFDGYSFKVYGEQQGLNDRVIFHMHEDAKGNIWMGGLKNKLFIYDPVKDDFTEYAHNSIIQKHITYNLQYLKYFHKTPDTLYVGLTNSGILKIANDGSFEYEPYCDRPANMIFEINGQAWLFRSYVRIKNHLYNNRLYILDKYGRCTKGNFMDLPDFDYLDSKGSSSSLVDSLYYINTGDNLYALDRKGVYHFTSSVKFNHVAKTKAGKIIVLYDHKEGAVMYDNHRLANPNHFLKDVSTTFFLEDNNGGYWISTLEAGIIYINPLQVSFVSDFHKNKYFRFITHGKNKAFIASTFSGEISSYSIETRDLNHIQNLNKECFVLAYDKYRDEIWYSSTDGLYIDNGKEIQEVIINNKGEDRRYYGAKSMVIHKDKIIVVAMNQYMFYDPHKRKVIFDSYNTAPSSRNFPKLYDVFLNETDLFLASQTGLLKIAGGKVRDSLKLVNEYNNRIETIDQLNENTLVLGTKGEGIIIYDYKKDRYLDTIKAVDGLSSNFIKSVYIADSSTVWVSTLKGLNKVDFGAELKMDHIHKFDASHGLPSNDIYGNIVVDGKVYAATGVGLVEFTDIEMNVHSPKPRFISISTEKQIFSNNEYPEFPHNQNNIQVKYVTLNYPLMGDIQYRYKLGNGEWVFTKDTEIRLLDLNHAKYKLEIQSENEDSIWSESLIIPFEIELPFWKTLWFWIIILFVVSGILYLGFLRYFKSRRKIDQIQNEMRKLEKVALRKQMNPHFIFNSLNSIQNFIMENEKGMAMEYLAMFARLIRFTLNAANEEKIIIADEVKILEHYLSLEQIRFEGRFEYLISVDKSIDQFMIRIPSMLIQPIVENAVVHGMKNKKQGGLIRVEFMKRGSSILVKVRDNGKGFEEMTADHSDFHRSYGIDITRKRLQLSKSSTNISGRIHLDRLDDGWTEVSLFIPL